MSLECLCEGVSEGALGREVQKKKKGKIQGQNGWWDWKVTREENVTERKFK